MSPKLLNLNIQLFGYLNINIFTEQGHQPGARGSVLVKALCYNPEGRGFEIHENEFFSIYLILPAAQGPEVHLTSNRNGYQKQKKMFLGSKVRPVRRANNLTAICEPII
jgi:hypothetical protein